MKFADAPGFEKMWLLLSFAASRHEEFVAWCEEVLEGME